MGKAKKERVRSAAEPYGVTKQKSTSDLPPADDCGNIDISAETARAQAGPRLSKTDKKALKHELLLQKLETTKRERARERRQQEAKDEPLLKADFSALFHALPDMDKLKAALAESSLAKAGGKHAPHVVSRRGREHTMAKEVAQFNAVVQHSAFKSNPLSIIQRHLAASIEKQQL